MITHSLERRDRREVFDEVNSHVHFRRIKTPPAKALA
jgi:hypothetical protein